MIEFAYDLCYMLPLNLVAAVCLLTYMGKGELCLAGCIMGSVFMTFVQGLFHAGKKERVLIGGIVAAALVGLYLVLGKEKRWELFLEYGFLLWIIVAAFICIVVGKIAEGNLWMQLLVIVALIGNMAFTVVYSIDIHSVAVSGSLFVIMVYLVAIIQKHWTKSGYTDIKSHVALTAPVLLVIFLLVSIIPAPKETFDWTFAKNIWSAIVTECNRVAGSFGGFGDEFSYAGFSTESSFSAGLGRNNKEVMVLRTDGTLSDNLYLGGIVFNTFTPEGWVNTEVDYSKADFSKTSNFDGDYFANDYLGTNPSADGNSKIDSFTNGNSIADYSERNSSMNRSSEMEIIQENYRKLDLMETRAAIIKFGQGYERDYIRGDVLTAESHMKNTKHIFVPTKVDLNDKRNILPEYEESKMWVKTTSKRQYGDSYSVAYYDLNYLNPDLITLIDTSAPLEEQDWNEMLKHFGLNGREEFSFDKYQRYRDFVYAEYGTSYGLSDEINGLLSGITKGIDGDYERVKAISDYLQSMEYNTNPGDLPNKITSAMEYLDYFMTESQKGFCVHYATALVLLARECGYPARYVQGYMVKNNGSNTVVMEDNTHSWAEVYFDNFGWVQFEATPGYRITTGWSVGKFVEPTLDTGYNPTSVNQENRVETEADVLPVEESNKKVFPIRYVVIPILLAAFFGVTFVLTSRLIMAAKYKKMNPDEKVSFLIQRNLRILRILGYPLAEGETVEEYGKRLDMELNGEHERLSSGDLKEESDGVVDKKTDRTLQHTQQIVSFEFLKIYERLLYSDYEVNEADLEVTESDFASLKKRLKKHGIKYLLLQ